MPPFHPSPVTPASKSRCGVCPAGGKAGVSAAFPDDPSMSPGVFLIVTPRAGLGGGSVPPRGVRRRPPRGGGASRMVFVIHKRDLSVGILYGRPPFFGHDRSRLTGHGQKD